MDLINVDEVLKSQSKTISLVAWLLGKMCRYNNHEHPPEAEIKRIAENAVLDAMIACAEKMAREG